MLTFIVLKGTHIKIYTYTNTHTHSHTHTHAHTHTNTYTHTQTHTHTKDAHIASTQLYACTNTTLHIAVTQIYNSAVDYKNEVFL